MSDEVNIIRRKIRRSHLLFVIIAFNIFAYLLMSLKSESFILTLLTGAAVIVMILGHCMLTNKLNRDYDELLLYCVYFLISLSMIIQYRLNESGSLRQLPILFASLAASLLVMWFVKINVLCTSRYKWVAAALSLLLIVLVLFIGQTHGGAKNWIKIADMEIQPSEISRILYIIAIAGFFTYDEYSGYKNQPQYLRATLFAVACVAVLVIEKDIGAAVIFTLVAYIMFFVSGAKKSTMIKWIIVFIIAALISYLAFKHVETRINAWYDPWISFENDGYQVAQGLMAIASGGLSGLGLYQGKPNMIPEYGTDYVFAVVCEEFGIIVGICVILIYFVLIFRGIKIALKSKSRFNMLMCLGIATLFAVQSFLIIGGVTKLIPVTGVTLPFLSRGGTSLLSSLIAVGILEGVNCYGT